MIYSPRQRRTVCQILTNSLFISISHCPRPMDRSTYEWWRFTWSLHSAKGVLWNTAPALASMTFSESFWKHCVHTTIAKEIHPRPMRISAPQICLMSSCCKNTSTEPHPHFHLDHKKRASALTQDSHSQHASGIFYNNFVEFRCAVDIRRQVPCQAQVTVSVMRSTIRCNVDNVK